MGIPLLQMEERFFDDIPHFAWENSGARLGAACLLLPYVALLRKTLLRGGAFLIPFDACTGYSMLLEQVTL